MEQIIANDRDHALTFCERGKRNSQRVAYWKEEEQIYKFERLPGEKMPTWQEGVGSHWWCATKTVAQKFSEIDTKVIPALTVRMPPETHRKLKVIAAESGLSMQGITLALIEDFVEGHERRII